VRLSREGRRLEARFEVEHDVVSWALVGGGRGVTRRVAWCSVTNAELGEHDDPVALLAGWLAAAGGEAAVGLLTSSDLDRYTDASVASGGVAARCVATVGLSNALRAGDPPGPLARVGTINLLCHMDCALGENALYEALALAAEARAAALLEAGVPSLRTGRPATGTGTDCIVIAAPRGEGGLAFVGKHTHAGHALGAAVIEAVTRGVEGWRARYGRALEEAIGG
jgi:adenosylcobinamide amidohydrolase